MKASNTFKNIINAHLQSVADKDPLFAETFKKPNKNIDDCITYILNTVQKSGCNGFADEEIFGMAMHYYDEDDVKPGSPVKATVVVNHQAEALRKTMSEPLVPEKKTPKKAKADSPAITQPSLFD